MSNTRSQSSLPAGALNAYRSPTPRPDLRHLSVVDLAGELVARFGAGETFTTDPDLVLASQLQDLLGAKADVHLNRFSRRRLFDVVWEVLEVMPPASLKGATVVDLGCGSLNPLALSFVLLMMGARRAYAIDLEPAQDPERAVRALATTASWLLVDPSYVVGEFAIDARSMIDNLAGFDLPSLAAGYTGGLADDRLIHRIASVMESGLSDGEADLVASVSLLEHVESMEAAVAELSRITRPGGIGHHIVDFIDHRVYGGEVANPLAFLGIDSAAPLVQGCNRVRCRQLCRLFEAHGFIVESAEPTRQEPVSAETRQAFVEPYRSLDTEELSILCARIVVRRR